ncbi:unnamed protein product [Effrenium voratum]|uniref:Uncharacterized protein n=1 Tax=Effrenium voratum TaxID=2562239 RepID=A0AA36HM94_9DINO|nr:unnamed protein product [Effrenium voratum]
MGCGSSVSPPLKKLDPAKFAKVFEKEKVTEIAWLNEEKCLLISEEQVEEENPPTREEDPWYKPPLKVSVEVYDVKSKELKLLSSMVCKFDPCGGHIAASADGQMYAVGVGKEVRVFKADGSETSKMNAYSNDSTSVSTMSFSPDGKHILVGSSNGGRKVAVMTVDGTEVYTCPIDDNYKFKVGLHWMDDKTVMILSNGCAAFHDISSKSECGKWWGPPKGASDYTHSMNPEGMRFMKTGRAYLAHKDDGQLFLLKPGGAKFKVLETFKLHDKDFGMNCGTKFAVLSDEQTVIYERPNGSNHMDPVPDHFEANVLASGGKSELSRGDAKLTRVEMLELNVSESVLATVDQEGAKLYSLGYKAEPAQGK